MNGRDFWATSYLPWADAVVSAVMGDSPERTNLSRTLASAAAITRGFKGSLACPATGCCERHGSISPSAWRIFSRSVHETRTKSEATRCPLRVSLSDLSTDARRRSLYVSDCDRAGAAHAVALDRPA